jgi:hypothetical protein
MRDVLPQLREMCSVWEGGDTIDACAVAGGVIADA